MKLPTLVAVFALSLAVNGVLLVTLPRAPASQAAAETDLAREAPGISDLSGTAGGHGLAVAAAPSIHDSEAATTPLPLHDLAALVSALRAKGYPPPVLRALVVTLVQREFESRYNALRSNLGPPPYWQTSQSGARTVDLETREARQRLAREQNERIQDLLGPDVPTPDRELMEISNRLRYGPLPTETIARLQAIDADYNELANQIRTESQGLLLPDDRAQLALLETEKRRDFLSVLTPAEYEEMQLRGSNTAQGMRSRLGPLNPTEEEFRTLFVLQRAFDEAYGQDQRRPSPDWQSQRSAAERQLLADIKASLGPERGEEYERTRDQAYVQVFNLATQLQLPRETALHVWTLQTQMTQQLNTLNSDRSLSPAQRQAQLQALARDASPQFNALLGEAGLETYRQTAGRWLRTLEERLAATTER